jgi:N-acyl-D-amino-acid deacylase
MFDLVVRGGVVVDGTGAAPVRADVGVAGGRIAAVASDLDGPQVVDATGRYVMPGFIDAHSHADAAVLDPAIQLATLRQGVTSVILGQDGLSYAPSTAAAHAFVTRYFAAINGTHPALGPGPVSVTDLREGWRDRTAVNTGFLVPHGTVRYSVLGGADREPDAAELAQMRRLVEAGLAEGALGLSTGLEYLPGRYANVAELVELCRPVAAAGLPYVSHMRGYGLAAPGGMAEARAIGVGSGVAVHISHYNGPGEQLESMVDEALGDGQDLSFDSYPYLRACTILAMVALPRWLDDTDLDRAAAALEEHRGRLVDELKPDLLARITLADVPHPQWRWSEGLALVDVARQVGRSPADLLLDLLVATRLGASGVIETPAAAPSGPHGRLGRHLRRRPSASAWLGCLRPAARPVHARVRRLDVGAGRGPPRRQPGTALPAGRPGRHPYRDGGRPRRARPGAGQRPG